jgi:hypothetical protein
MASKVWHPQQEVVLKTWGEASACYRYMHHKTFKRLKRASLWFSLPIIVISTLTGTANFAHDSVPPAIKMYTPLIIGAFNIFGGLLSTVQQFLKVNELMESHRVSAMGFSKLSRHIRLELSLPVKDRARHGIEMINLCQVEYDRLLEQSQPIPSAVVAEFNKDFPVSSNISLWRPDIITIHPIVPYSEALRSFQVPVVTDTKKYVIDEMEQLKQRGVVSKLLRGDDLEIRVDGDPVGNVQQQDQENQVKKDNP